MAESLPQLAGALPARQGFGVTRRCDPWWVTPTGVFVGLSVFVIYSTWAVFTHHGAEFGNYVSPIHVPVLFGDTAHAWFGPKPAVWPAFLPWAPGVFLFWAPAGLRLTCYYYRGSYYKAFWGSPASCTVGKPWNTYRGENSFPLILQNVHRYFLYIALVWIGLHLYYVWGATRFADPVTGEASFGLGVGTLVMALNAALLAGYTLGCHSLRHLAGGFLDRLSGRPLRRCAYECTSWFNLRHMGFAWASLVWVMVTDVYVRLCATGVVTDYRILYGSALSGAPRRERVSAQPPFPLRWRRALGQLVFPQCCCLCDRPLADPLASPACPECTGSLRPLAVPACLQCGLFLAPSGAPGRCGECRARRRPFRMAVAAAPYEGVFQRALLELKFRRREVLAELLARPATAAFRRAPRDHDAGTAGAFPAAVVPVPVPFWRGRRRGFNQAELLARPVAREFGIPLVRGVLRRRSRPPQTLVSPSARRRNVRGAFRAGRLPEGLVGRPLLLVDDVFTTGSTVEAAVRALIRAGAGPVDVLTVARAVTAASR